MARGCKQGLSGLILRRKVSTPRVQAFFKLVLLAGTLYFCFIILYKRESNLKELITVQLQPDDDKQACVHPKLNPWEMNMMKHFYEVPMPKCNDMNDWIDVENGSAWITQNALKEHGLITCRIAYIHRGYNDDTIKYELVEELTGNQKLKLKSDFFKAACKSLKDMTSYENIHAGVAYKNELQRNFTADENKPLLSVLMIGFDSISHMTYIRKLPKTLTYFEDELHGIVLKGYNIVGDGTPQAFIPILTGQTELELPRTLRIGQRRQFVDIYPMIWKDFKRRGYITSFNEDTPKFGMFTYRMNGFQTQPTDHYMRPFFLADDESENLCLGSKRKSAVFMHYARQMFYMYSTQPKFIISFFSTISHNRPNMVGTGDEDLFNLLTDLNKNRHLNSTILILMSDHGARFQKMRSELQGKQEERMPFFGFAFPTWFKNKYPVAYRNFVLNRERLTTPFDVHATLKSILNDFVDTNEGKSSRGLSLFTEIPKSRTCGQAGIPMHWCACLNWHGVSVSNINIQKATKFVIERMNDYIAKEKKCRELTIHNITRAVQFLPDKSLVKFLKSADVDGFQTDMSDETFVDKVLYQINFYTAPNSGYFEVTVTLDLRTSKFAVNMNDVSRINAYGHDADCAHRSAHDIRKFCSCKK